MSFVMAPDEREAFLAGVHVGVLAVERDGRAPLAVPIWYDYRDGEILLWMHRGSAKDRAIRAAGRFSFTVQSETVPYRYVTAEGPVTAADRAPTRAEATAIAGRYLPDGEAAAFVGDGPDADSVLVRMRPERWLSNDQSKT
ncbi:MULTISPECIES: pyridoxamine 5'-phosphate oxidase family protein [Pseudonocardia]|uniref:Pyridoxamine 5'-phosphate oxidase n=2 Tax=Pseudonocardia TaxID=1847 RepID=A0A1Y2MMR0_PSEAH|nr:MULTISPECIES: pyridoxamine 5'-phosphate oxidase family protein [Pseudonocardia]OSY36545.1 Pyridoxamine 5'-phosphate oxidase [Pseudonocardia autotrophica]TDN76275.1 PPOX class probable F420-dependent enzyme [Pseudonocardia autotrophica]BBG00258.1 pyridoxamine 5'-phosphate oxidase [Pseudonocardia autotrophica]GEC29560.1 pyridoxamine 5'-phosphate oxidase [Pseudonocardia saturnea]